MVHHEGAHPPSPAADTTDRRGFTLAGAAMAGGLVAGYGMFAYIAARFLYPAAGATKGWLFVLRAQDLAIGQSLRYRTPGGATVNITRRSAGVTVDDFIALSSTCPHLGCQVHWQGDQNRYFCPCHNGTFDAQGKGTGGPPGDAGQSLEHYSLKVEQGLLYIEVPMQTLAAAESTAGKGQILAVHDGPEGPGHDPCLQPPHRRPCQANACGRNLA